MKKILVIGGSKGIGKAIVASLIEKNNIINLSRTPPSLAHENLTHYNCDILTDELPQLDAVDALIYCPGKHQFKTHFTPQTGGFQSRFRNQCCRSCQSNSTLPSFTKKGDYPIHTFI